TEPCPRCGGRDWVRNSKDRRIRDRLTLRMPRVCKTCNLLVVPAAGGWVLLGGALFAMATAAGAVHDLRDAVNGISTGAYVRGAMDFVGFILMALLTLMAGLAVMDARKPQVSD
ncbi:MAG: hypothetical protein JXB13_03180, partial [Phycisphaerae bacterium]|nr:hypothetical protein [Phycisphaerae bacterium]